MNKKTLVEYLDYLGEDDDIRFHENYISIDKAENPGHIVWATVSRDGRYFTGSRSMGDGGGSLLHHDTFGFSPTDLSGAVFRYDASTLNRHLSDANLVISWHDSSGSQSVFESYKKYTEGENDKARRRFQLPRWILDIARAFRRN